MHSIPTVCGSYSFPIQWIPVWNTDAINRGLFTRQTAMGRLLVRCTAQFQAHLFISSFNLLHLHFIILLLPEWPIPDTTLVRHRIDRYISIFDIFVSFP
jgi:hypothetical protein